MRLFKAAQRSLVLRIRLSPPQNIPWNIGCRSIKGPVRTRNDDYGLAFEVNGHQVVLLADGVSGEPFGGKSAFWAIQCAAWSIIKQFAEDRGTSGPHPDTIAAQAILAAASGIGRLASAFEVLHGLRTTLIIVVATPSSYGYAYIGDGKGYIIRSNGTPEQFLIPQREAGTPSNLIAACLGPHLLGAPITGALSRQSGDFLVVGTDGIFSESVEWSDDYLHRVLGIAGQFDGDLQRAVDHELQQLASTKDNLGFLFDDNMTLALIGDRALPPKCLSQGDAESLQTNLVLPHASDAIYANTLRA
jgi:serine/threonine protein phosphatase PrpC